VHEVTLTKGFYLGKYEVTQAQYEAVMVGNDDGLSATPSHFSGNPNRPVEEVSWDGIQVFLTRLNAQEAGNIPAGWAYVLPTEAQWEYACRAGTTTAYSLGDTITSSDANYESSIGSTICMAMFENGRQMHQFPMHREHKLIHLIHFPPQARPRYSGVAHGVIGAFVLPYVLARAMRLVV
jgi:formylglycine-generating enzyme required for sulfatase activity